MKKFIAHLIFSTGILISPIFGQENCHKIELIGPAGFIFGGDLAIFSLHIDPAYPSPLKIDWVVSSGTIEQGLGTPNIFVRTAREEKTQRLTVSVHVHGLPINCPSSASTSASIQPTGGDPVMFDEFGRLPVREERLRIGAVAHELTQNPGYTAYFILYRNPGESLRSETARMQRITDHLVNTRKIPRDRFVVVSGGKFIRSTKVYMVPPGAPKPPH